MNTRYKIVLLVLIVAVSAVAHAYNMFHFPYYENDEAIYLSRAWSLIKYGELAPYTYWYDHAPVGWLMLAVWVLLTGGFFTFGFSINTGRVFMLLLHLISTVLLYFSTKKLTKSNLASVLAVLLFSLSPLAIYFHRRILLDNIMTFWLLVSLYFILFSKHRLRRVIYSGLAFGLAFLSKETAVFFGPAYLYTVYALSHLKHRIFSITQWLTAGISVTALYVIYATIKGELFPPGWFTQEDHVSLLGTLAFQAGRDGGSIFTPADSHFWYNMGIWFRDDPFFMSVGLAAIVINLGIGIKALPARIASLLALSILVYLMRGGIVIEFYVIPLFPFMAMNVAVTAVYLGQAIATWWSRYSLQVLPKLQLVPTVILLFGLPPLLIMQSFSIRHGLNIYTANQTSVQHQAVEWILHKEHPGSFYVIDNYGFIDLMEHNKNNFEQAHHYWTVEHDPELRDEILGNLPQGVDYFLVSPQLQQDLGSGGFPILGEALGNSRPVIKFWNDNWGVEIWSTQYTQRILESSWYTYRENFIAQGKVTDPQTEDTTSEGQSYALLRAVLMNDQQTFNQVLAWSDQQLLRQDGLYMWSYRNRQNDQGAASDADQDIALALLFAYKRWGDPSYLEKARSLLAAIWQHEVVVVAGKNYISAGNWANTPTQVIVNPSYLSPSHYPIFAAADPEHDWQSLVETSYWLLDECTFNLNSARSQVLPPEWCALNKNTGRVSVTQPPQPVSTDYSYNAFRIPWKIALDHTWHQTPQSQVYLSKLKFLADEWATHQRLWVAYTHVGEPWETYESVAAYAGNLGYFLVMNAEQADAVYKTKIRSKFFEDETASYWEDSQNYYTQNWGWFATALYGQQFTNLWE